MQVSFVMVKLVSVVVEWHSATPVFAEVVQQYTQINTDLRNP